MKPMRLEPAALSLESSTLTLSHCAPGPQGLIGRIYHKRLLHIKYISFKEYFLKFFLIISLLELYVAIVTKVLISSAQNHYAAFPQLYMKLDHIKSTDLRYTTLKM